MFFYIYFVFLYICLYCLFLSICKKNTLILVSVNKNFLTNFFTTINLLLLLLQNTKRSNFLYLKKIIIQNLQNKCVYLKNAAFWIDQIQNS